MKALNKLFQRKPKNLDGDNSDFADDDFDIDGVDDDLSPASEAMAINDDVRRKQMIIFSSLAGVMALAGCYYIFSGDDTDKTELAGGNGVTTTVSTDAMVNRNMSEQAWMSRSEAQMVGYDRKIDGMQNQIEQIKQLEDKVSQSDSQIQTMTNDGQRVISAYEQENAQLKAALQAAKTSPVAQQAFAGPQRLYGAQSPATFKQANGPQAGAAAGAVAAPPAALNEVKLVSFGEAKGGGGTPVDRGNTVYSDSANYLPPNSIAPATVIVGVDASAGVNSQTDPLPVVLRVTGPARSVYDKGRLLTTNIAGCLVNGAARGDLSSEKVYIKLQRMTCPQPNGRYAVSEVKGFVAFAGKAGVRGPVVSREGSLVGQAFLAGLVGGIGKGFGANATSFLQGPNISVDGKRDELSTGEILKGGLGEGVSNAGDMVSKYMIERAEQYQPVIAMPTGIKVEIVFLDGVFVKN